MVVGQRLSKACNGYARPVAVIGAGIAGLTLAVRLRQAGQAVSVFEARGREGLSEGAFLTLAPNGVNALRAIGLADRISVLGIPTLGFEIMSGKGKRLALLDETAPMLAAGALSVTLKRADLLGTLCREAETLGAEIHFNHALSGLEQLPGGIGLQFANGETRAADWVAGCDGVWSRTRRLAFPGAPDPVYTGLTGTGGFADVPSIPATDGFMRMVFGDTAFFGYIKEGDGPVFWFDSFPLDEEEALAKPDPAKLAALARSLHVSDPEPVRRITAAVDAVARTYPVFDMQHLPRWHDDRVVLLGDAAHAVSPHAGQGASMAIEDAVVLAACVAAQASCGMAFAAYQRLRQQRVERIVRVSRRIGSQKRASSRFALFMRDLILPWVIPLSARAGRSVNRYRADLDPLSRPTT
jgi:2-polyprenyl-6-methoxyphenol hydroxylase-like FAD-dependent oxidoreductase